MNSQNEHETYYIPPNFIEGSTLFGGMFKLRNVIEAGIIAVLIGLPIFSLDLSLTVRIIVLCLTALPLALVALIGISGECLSSFILSFFKFVFNRRVIGRTENKKPVKTAKKKLQKESPTSSDSTEVSMLSEIIAVIRKRSAYKEKTNTLQTDRTEKKKPERRRNKTESRYLNPVAEYLPIEKIENGIIYTKDRRYIKVIEVIPINFLLRSAREQRNIIFTLWEHKCKETGILGFGRCGSGNKNR